MTRDDWQPIAMAPRDTHVLLWTGNAYQVGWYDTVLKRWATGWGADVIRATQWMALPLPPANGTVA